jgi:hypothetical protein
MMPGGRKLLFDPPQEMVRQVLAGRLLERRHAHSEGIETAEDVPDHAVLSAGVHALQDR